MFKIAKILSPESPPPFTNIINYNMSKIPAINEIDANSPSQESKEVVIKATDVSPDVNEIQETISGAATIQEVDGTRKPTISEIYKIVTDGLFESTSNWWDYAYKLSQAQINQDIIARLDRGEIGGGYSKGVDIITTTSNKVPSNTNVYSALKSDTLYPKKLNNETINGIYNFVNGITIGKPTAYTGGTWSIDQLGKTHLTTDYLYVRLKAIFETLQILNVDTIGGKLVISPAGSINIVYVDNIKVTIDGNEQNVYRCYFLGEQEGEEIENKWKVGDQAQAKSFNIKKGTYHKTGNHYLWRLVVGVSTDTVTIDGKKYHYIDLSQLISDVGSDAPAPGDVLNQLGHRGDDLQRQTAIVLNAVDNYAPSITLYAGINDFTLLNKEYVEYGVYQGKAFFNVYGDMYIGDKGDNPTTYIKYKNGKIDIKANLTIGSSIDGKDLDKYIKENGGVDEETVKSLINNAQVIKDIQNQVDGAIETWFYEGEPTLTNLPAVDWATNEIKKIHVGDLYYDQITGFAYRFTRYNDDVNPYAWNRIKDNDIVQALEAANNAQITADGKMKIFYNTKPTDYQVGDIWILPADTIINGVQYYKGDILTATVKSAEFNEKHWTKKIRYIGSKELNDNIDKVNKKINDISATTLPGLNDKFNEFAKDGILDSSEKARLTDLLNQANNEVLSVNEQITNIIKSDYLTNDNINKDKLIKAQKTLSTAWTEYKTLIYTLIASTNLITKINIAEASSKYTNLQNSIKAVKQYLAACQADILSNIGIDISSYKYLKEAFKGKTEINGGLVVTNVLQLRQTSDVNSPITAGISGLQGKADENGVVDKDTYDITSIAAWFGGPMVDKDIFTDEQLKNKVAGTDYARSLFRHDGSGYLASGAIYWRTDGILHADPTSFIISEKNLGAYLTFFEPTWKAGSAGTSVADLVSLKPNAPFTKLGVSGDATFEGAISFHGIKLTYDATNKAIKIDGNLYATGGITAYGAASSGAGGGGLNASVISYARIIEGSYTDADLTSIPNAYAIKALSSRIDNIATELGGLNLSWNNITGKPSTFAPSAHKHKWVDITDRITKVSQLTNDAGYLTAHQSLASYYTKAEIDAKGYTTNKGTVTSVALTLPTGLVCATKTITTSGTFAISLASGYSIPTTAKQAVWDGAVSAKHTHSNKSVLDGISSVKVTHWDSAYDWYALMTTDEETADGIINKWNEVVSFLANIAQTDTLSGIVDGINKSISDEVTRAKKAEGVNASGISTNKTNITTLQGYFTSGSAKKALQLTNARKLWGNSFNGTADINGSIIVPNGKYISIGNIKMEYDATNKALKITNTTTNEVANLYTSGGVSAYGVGTSSSSGGGLNGSVKAYADAIRLTTENLSEIASAYSVAKLYSEIQNVASAVPSISVSVPTGGNALTGATYDASTGVITFTKGTFLTAHQSLDGYVNAIAVSGSGNAVTAISKNGTTISVTKGTTFLTSHQSLASYLTKTDAARLYQPKGNYLTAHQNLDGYVNEIATSGTGNAITSVSKSGKKLTFTKGVTFLTSHQSLSAYLKSADAANTYLKLSGGAMTGNIRYKGSKNTYDMITFVDNNVDAYGNGICIGGGGLTIIGGGESASEVLKQHTNGGDENMIVANDAAIDFFSNMNSGWASRKAGSFDTSGYWNGVGFKKDNSNDNYVLTGGGGHKAISTLSVSYASSAGSANSVAWGNVNGRPTKVSQFTNDSNYATQSWVTGKGYLTSHQDISGKVNRTGDYLDTDSDRWWLSNSEFGINLHNSDIVGVNSIYTSDVSNGPDESISFKRSNGNYDTLRMADGVIWFGTDYAVDKTINEYQILHTNNISMSSTSDGFINMSVGGVQKQAYIYAIGSIDGYNSYPDGRTTSINDYTKGLNRLFLTHATSSLQSSQRPLGNDGHILHFGWDNNGGWDAQLAITANGDKPYIAVRAQYNGTWRNWYGAALLKFTNYITGNGGLMVERTDKNLDTYMGVSNGTYDIRLMIGSGNVNRGIYDTARDNWMLYRDSSTNIYMNGNVLATGGITAYSSSDIRLKQDLRKLDYFGIIKMMGGTFGFAWKKDNTRSIGWIAQHVLCNPHLKDIVETDENGYYKINYWSPKLIATAFGAIEQVGDEVSRLKARVVFLESEVQRLSGKQDSSNKKRLDNKNINLLN